MYETLARQPLHRKVGSFAQVDMVSALASFIICVSIIAAFGLTSDKFAHWFVLPVLLCGALIGIDAVDWVRGRLDVFDPVGLLGLVGFHFFFLAPLLHVHWNHWMAGTLVTPPQDWRVWLGSMAVLNLLGILVYRLLRNPVQKYLEGRSKQAVWVIDKGRFLCVLVFGLLISLMAQILVYSAFEGLAGYITTYQESITSLAARETSYKGMGVVFMLSESFPLLTMVGFAVLARKSKLLSNWVVLLLIVAVFVGLEFLFGGLRGSRSNVVFMIVWGVGIIHLWVRPVPRVLIYFGMAFLVLFMYYYGFYKSAGTEGLQALESPTAANALEEKTGRTSDVVILGDLGRSDVQAFLLYRLTGSTASNYEYAWGETYLAAASLLIPESVLPERPPSKVEYGTEAQYGIGSYVPNIKQSSKIYGLAGEAMLNFGPLAIPFAFSVLGIFVGWVRHLFLTLAASDTRLLLLPFLVILSLVVLTSDLDNLLFFVIKNASIPFLVIWLGSRRLVFGVPSTEHRLGKPLSTAENRA